MECPPGFEEVPAENSKYGKVYTCQKCSGKIYLNYFKWIDRS